MLAKARDNIHVEEVHSGACYPFISMDKLYVVLSVEFGIYRVEADNGYPVPIERMMIVDDAVPSDLSASA